jgi:DNA-binding MarR family transcriptional regulator
MHLHAENKIDANAFLCQASLMTENPSVAVVAAWAALLRAERRVVSAVEADLKAADLLSPLEYDILLELGRAGAAGLRPMELEARLGLAQYRVSRLLDRLRKSGAARRRPCAEDGRGALVVVTDEGRRLLKSMWPTYAAAIVRHLGARLDSVEASELARLLGVVTREAKS